MLRIPEETKIPGESHRGKEVVTFGQVSITFLA